MFKIHIHSFHSWEPPLKKILLKIEKIGGDFHKSTGNSLPLPNPHPLLLLLLKYI